MYVYCNIHSGVSDHEVRQEGMYPPTTVAVKVKGQPVQAMGLSPRNMGYGMQ